MYTRSFIYGDTSNGLYAFRYLAVQVGVVAAVVKYRRYK